MSGFVKDGKVFGIIPVGQYAKIAYLLVVGASVIGLLLTLLSLGGINLGLGMVVTLAGLIGLLMAVVGIFLLKEDLSALDVNHFMYITVLWVAFLILGVFLGAIFGGYIILILSLVFAVAQTLLLYTGYNSWSRGRTIDKNNISSEIQAALKRS